MHGGKKDRVEKEILKIGKKREGGTCIAVMYLSSFFLGIANTRDLIGGKKNDELAKKKR